MSNCCLCLPPETRFEGTTIAYQISSFDDMLYRKEGMMNFYHDGGVLAKSLVFVSIPFKVVGATVAATVAKAVCSVVFPFMAFKDAKFLPAAMDCLMATVGAGGWIALSIYVLPLSAAVAVPATFLGIRVIYEWGRLVKSGPEALGSWGFNQMNKRRNTLGLNELE